MLALAIAMGTVVWAMIGYALLSPEPPAPEGADYRETGGSSRQTLAACRDRCVPGGPPRTFNASAICASVVAPAFRAASM